MPKTHGTKKERRKELFNRITPEHLFNNTSVFSGYGLEPKLMEQIKQRYTLYYTTWLESSAREFILNEKEEKH